MCAKGPGVATNESVMRATVRACGAAAGVRLRPHVGGLLGWAVVYVVSESESESNRGSGVGELGMFEVKGRAVVERMGEEVR